MYDETKPGLGGEVLPGNPPKKKVYNKNRIPEEYLREQKCLRFECYFEEKIPFSRLESVRVRHCVLYFHLEDGTITVHEPKVVAVILELINHSITDQECWLPSRDYYPTTSLPKTIFK